MTPSKRGVLLAVPLIATLMLAGCTTDGQVPFNAPNASISPMSDPSDPFASPVLPDGTTQDRLTAGETVDAATAEALRRPYYGYQLPDGTYTVVKSDEPLPAAVQEAVKAEMAPGAAAVRADPANGGQAFENALTALERKTGKTIVVVQPFDDYEGGVVWAVSLPVQNNFPTKAEAMAKAEAATKSGDNRYAIIVID